MDQRFFFKKCYRKKILPFIETLLSWTLLRRFNKLKKVCFNIYTVEILNLCRYRTEPEPEPELILVRIRFRV